MNPNKLIIFLLPVLLWTCDSDDDSIDDGSFKGIAEWARTFGGSDADFGFSLLETNDGNIAILGYTSSTDGDIIDKTLNVNDYWLVKVDIDGNLLWNKTYGGSGDDRGRKLIQTNDGGFAMAGYSMSSDGDGSNNEGFHDNWIVKTDADGTIQWENSFGFSGHDHAYALLQTDDSGYFMAGFLDVTSSGGAGNTNRSANISSRRHGTGEFWCHRLDAQGNVIWQRYFGGTNNDRAFDVLQSNDGGFIVTGYSESDDFDITDGRGTYDYWVLKLSASGDLLWQKSFGGTGIDQSRAIIKTDDNAYIVVGNSFSDDVDINNNLGSSDFWLIKISDEGNIIWKHNYGGSDFDYATNIRSSVDGYVVCGYSKSNNHDLSINYGDNDFWVMKIDESGNLIWQKNFGGSGLDLAHDVIETTTGHIYVVGETESNDYDITENKGMKDLLLVKIR